MKWDDAEVTATKRRLGINSKQLALICYWLAKTLAPDTPVLMMDAPTWLRVFMAMDPETQEGLVQDHKERMRIKRRADFEKFGVKPWGRK
jgi:hypothetical protein